MNELFTLPFFILLSLTGVTSVTGAWFILSIRRDIKRLAGDDSASSDEHVVYTIMRRIARLEAKAEEIDPRLAVLEKIAVSSIQKVGFVRFNPFPDTGGDNSFMLVMLDRENTGVLLSSLYMREGVRLYAKSIERGKAKHVLSAEEANLLEDTLQTI